MAFTGLDSLYGSTSSTVYGGTYSSTTDDSATFSNWMNDYTGNALSGNNIIWSSWQDPRSYATKIGAVDRVSGRYYTTEVAHEAIKDYGQAAMAHAAREMQRHIAAQQANMYDAMRNQWQGWDAAQQQQRTAYEYNNRYSGRVQWAHDRPTVKDRIQRLYARNQATINSIWQEILAEEQRQARALAEKTAQDMLLDLIGEDEFKVYKQTGKVLVKGRKADYLISKTEMVKKIPKGKIYDLGMKQRHAKKLCIHLRNRSKYPETDNVIALAHLFKYEEEEANKIANDWGVDKLPTVLAANF